MTESKPQLELKQILGALLLGAKTPLSAGEIRKILADVAAEQEGEKNGFGALKEKDVREAMARLGKEIEDMRIGIHIAEVAGGYRYQTDLACAPWLRRLLNLGKPERLSMPAMETLAIIAYRQPVTRSEIESVRGVNVDSILRNLLEMQLVRIVGRSELPGRPLLYGTTQIFLEHFGLKSVEDLPGREQLAKRTAPVPAAQTPEQKPAEQPVAAPGGEACAGAPQGEQDEKTR